MHYTTWNLWTILKANGQSMTWLSRSSGVSRSLLYLIKRGEWPVTRATGEKIARAMRLPFEALFLPVESTSGSDNRSSGIDNERAAD